MAKKSSAARQNAARRTQTATKASGAVLLAPPNEGGAGTEAATKTVAPVAKAVTKAAPPFEPKRGGNGESAPRSQTTVTKPAAAAKPAPVRSVAPRSGVQASVKRPGGGGRGMTAREQEIRLARARATQRARAANLITPEHYSYVLGDLRLILGVAAVFVAILVVLHFALPQ